MVLASGRGILHVNPSTAYLRASYGDFHFAWRSFSDSARSANQYFRSRSRSAVSSAINARSRSFIFPRAAWASSGRVEEISVQRAERRSARLEVQPAPFSDARF